MIVAGLVLAAVAALVHVYIFFLESIAWTSPRALRTFGQTREAAEAQKELAFNQGFYNLFLAIVAALGVVLFATGAAVVGATLVFTGVGSMLAASLVLLISSPDKAAAALKQGLVPALSVIALAIGLAL
ncbi:hypothetical protein GCM10017576_17290 [Microbacterium barkeri]|uniref:DUF1304 domain-containing protein n=1 Tax=Microbacterium barkeri TaxID=33917 RepID=A0A9W6LWA8_9MICO|nr:DUF1304 domain-containing protein [Microbacterium barkeri]MDI6943593.1 DUF1304 domain-containing protein [Microbacterium barkeri]MDR6875552.1 putative membrane protein [Microbacterium barkeri]GLJ61599.1 hypothetical protein GCM10017576_17290 [Microbacterium barkeri]